jgi:hypothetical protein
MAGISEKVAHSSKRQLGRVFHHGLNGGLLQNIRDDNRKRRAADAPVADVHRHHRLGKPPSAIIIHHQLSIDNN